MNSLDVADRCREAEDKAHNILEQCGLEFNTPAKKNSGIDSDDPGYSPYYISCNYGAAENVREVRIVGILYGVPWDSRISLVTKMYKGFPDSNFKVLQGGSLNCILTRFERENKNSPWKKMIG